METWKQSSSLGTDLAAQALAQFFNADDSDHSDSTVACACGGKARYAGRRSKTFTTLLGPLTLERAYYHCDACRTGVCPRDRTLGYARHVAVARRAADGAAGGLGRQLPRRRPPWHY